MCFYICLSNLRFFYIQSSIYSIGKTILERMCKYTFSLEEEWNPVVEAKKYHKFWKNLLVGNVSQKMWLVSFQQFPRTRKKKNGNAENSLKHSWIYFRIGPSCKTELRMCWCYWHLTEDYRLFTWKIMVIKGKLWF